MATAPRSLPPARPSRITLCRVTPHSMSSSARRRTLCGIVKPMARAVFRLTGGQRCRRAAALGEREHGIELAWHAEFEVLHRDAQAARRRVDLGTHLGSRVGRCGDDGQALCSRQGVVQELDVLLTQPWHHAGQSGDVAAGARLAQRIAQRLPAQRAGGVGANRHQANASTAARRVLCPGRRRQHAAQREQCAAAVLRSINLSARSSTHCGTVMPKALAVFRLMQRRSIIASSPRRHHAVRARCGPSSPSAAAPWC